MMATHTRRKDLQVAAWAVAEYNSRPKDETAQLLMQANFDKDWPGLLIYIRSVSFKSSHVQI